MPFFVLFSVHNHSGFREFVKERGIDYIIEKPPNSDEIMNILIDCCMTQLIDNEIKNSDANSQLSQLNEDDKHKQKE